MVSADSPNAAADEHEVGSLDAIQRIESSTERISSAAGQWEGCLRVKCVATVRLFANPTSGWCDLPLTTLERCCPGVGLLRLERQEPVKSAFLTGGVVKMELMSWQAP